MLGINNGSTEVPYLRIETLGRTQGMFFEERGGFCCPCCGAQFKLSKKEGSSYTSVTVEFASYPDEVEPGGVLPEVYEGVHAQTKGEGEG
jgi:hypothetical protein